MSNVQNEKPAVEDVQPVIDEQIVNTVHDIFEAVTNLNNLDNIFEDLANRLSNDLEANSLLEYNLELSDDQKAQLRKVVKIKGNDVVRNYLANLANDERSKKAYGIVREKTTEIADAILSSIGQEINRGAVINAQAVQANSKNKAYDEILLRKTKTSGDITVPTSCILISTNCVEVIKESCQKKGAEENEDGEKSAGKGKPGKGKAKK